MLLTRHARQSNLEQVTQDGYANINVVRTWNEVLWPMSMGLSFALLVPYFIAVVRNASL
jgi:hypothetical protein